ncbi:glycosyltransferase family 2 protein [Cellulomonas endophytica]|uniref:glycosyltransferase family 2 protein n=1 Tax=Cellulomonas endophytica TaxID=2494735 RepID=UPI0010136969|nr:glycosyltransferase family 2 protein [Cellulomonas endophytica]
MSAPLVTVALPVYNAQEFLTPAVESLLGQTMGDLELVITDNASTDATEDMVRAWMREDDRIRYDRAPVNRGLAWNWNRAVPMARGRYFKWAAADDMHLPGYLEATVGLLEEDPTAVLAHCRTMDVDENGQFLGLVPNGLAMDAATPHERFHALTHKGWPCVQIFGLMRLDVLRMTGLHGAYPRSDRALLAEMGLHGRLVEVPEVLFHRREYSGRTTRATDLRTRYPVFTGGPVPPAPMPHWDLLEGFLAGLRRAPLPAAERARCLAALSDYTQVSTRGLLRELQRRTFHVAGLSGRSTPKAPAVALAAAPAPAVVAAPVAAAPVAVVPAPAPASPVSAPVAAVPQATAPAIKVPGHAPAGLGGPATAGAGVLTPSRSETAGAA